MKLADTPGRCSGICSERSTTISSVELESWVTELYIRINRAIRQRADEYSAVVRRALVYIHEHYAEPISLSHIADHLGMTQQYVSKRFKEDLGVNYVDYLNCYRLDSARGPLTGTTRTIREVGASVGFANPQYFIKHFPERFGLTPAQYRESSRSEP